MNGPYRDPTSNELHDYIKKLEDERDELREDRDLWKKSEADCSRNYNELLEERDELNRQFELQWGVTCEAVEAWRIDTNNHEVLPDYQRLVRWLLAERDDLKRELDTYQNGYQGSCTTCEPVARQNTELREEVDQYQWLLEQAKTLRDDNMRMREALEAVCNEVGWLWLLDETKKLLAVALQTTGNPASYDTAKRSTT